MPENHKGSNNGGGTPRGQGPPSGARGQSIRPQGQTNSTAKANSTAKKGTEQYYNIASELLGQDSNFEVVFLNAARVSYNCTTFQHKCKSNVMQHAKMRLFSTFDICLKLVQTNHSSIYKYT